MIDELVEKRREEKLTGNNSNERILGEEEAGKRKEPWTLGP